MSRLAVLRPKIVRLLQRLGFSRDWFLIPLAAVVGILAGLVAIGFAAMVNLCDNFFFQTIGGRSVQQSHGYPILLLIFLPAMGGLAVGLIQKYISRKPPSHGIPDVIESLARHGGVMPGRAGIFAAINSSLTIGSGGSAGMEGPIVQIGSVLGSVVGQVLHVGREHMTTLVGCGAAAGLASIFNAPIAGAMFVLEVMIRDFSMRNIMPLFIASVFGVATTQAVLGRNEAIFTLTLSSGLQEYGFTMGQIGWYVILGVLCGFVGVMFIRGLYISEKFWASKRIPQALKPAAGGLGLGMMGLSFVLVFGQPIPGYRPPVFFSNGYPVAASTLLPQSYSQHPLTILPDNIPSSTTQTDTPTSSAPGVNSGLTSAVGKNSRGGETIGARADRESLGQESWISIFVHAEAPATVAKLTIVLLIVSLGLKIIGTCLTLGSGGSGGTFAPCLVMGALLGGAFGLTLQQMGLVSTGTPATFALAGMAGVLAGAVHCPLTAFLLVFEITRDYKVILPVMLVSILATLIAQVRLRDSIYTLALHERGIRMGSHADLTILRRLEVAATPLTPAVLVHPQDPAQRLIDLAEDYAVTDYVVCDDQDHYIGMVVGEDVRTTLLQREAVPLMIVSELMRTDLPTVNRNETLEIVLDKFARHEVSSLTMIDDNRKVLGMITRSRLMRHYQQELDQQG